MFTPLLVPGATVIGVARLCWLIVMFAGGQFVMLIPSIVASLGRPPRGAACAPVARRQRRQAHPVGVNPREMGHVSDYRGPNCVTLAIACPGPGQQS
jgi:hypothetical protein